MTRGVLRPRAAARLVRAAALAAFVLVVGCARKQPAPLPEALPAPAVSETRARHDLLGSPRTPVSDLDLGAAERALAEASKALGDVLAASAPDCELARSLRDRICDLAERICRLAGADPDVKSRCDDGKSRCEDARRRVASGCP